MSKAEYKVVMVGDTGVGKTSLVEKFYSGGFNDSQHTTIGAAYVKCLVDIDNNETVTLNLWDTAGQERFQSLIPLYLRNALGIIFVFDLTATNPLAMLDQLYDSLIDQLNEGIEILLCGNKVDLKEVDQEYLIQYIEWAQKHNTTLMITSAKTGRGVKELFVEIANRVHRNPHRKLLHNSTVESIVSPDEEPQKSCC